MESVIIKKILPAELRTFVGSMKDAYLSGNSFIIQPKSGTVRFNFSELEPSYCIIKFKRMSGNGIVMLSSGSNSKDYQINSKMGQGVSHPILDGTLSLHRTQRSRGDISIAEVILYKESNTAVDWNKEISKAKQHSCIRLVGNDLMASGGSFIKGKNIEIETDPMNVFIYDGEDTVKFIKSCRIVNLSIDGPSVKKEAPIKIIEQPKESVVYDSSVSGFSRENCNDNVTINNNGITIDYKGEYSIPLRKLNHENTYYVTIDISRVNGNGKFLFGILPDDNKTQTRIASRSLKSYTTEIIPVEGSNFYTLSVWRDLSSKGQIHVGRILVTSEYNEPIAIEGNGLSRTIEEDVKPNDIKTSRFLIINSSEISDKVKGNSLKYSRIINSEYDVSESISTESTIDINTFSGLVWFGRVKPFIPNISQTSSNPKVSISSIKNLIQAKKMYIEGFENDIIDGDIDIIKQAESVFVSSEANADYLRQKIDNIKVSVSPLLLPFIKPKKLGIINNHIVINNENDKVTNYLIDNIESKNDIVVLNARGKYPNNVFPVNEYIDYSELVHIISSANCYIHIPIIENSKSEIVELSINCGVQVISTSWAYMDEDNVSFISSNKSLKGSPAVPNKKDLMKEISSLKKKNKEASNKDFMLFLNNLFS